MKFDEKHEDGRKGEGGLLSHEDPKSDKLAELSHAGELPWDEWESAGPLPRWPDRQGGAAIPAS